jgi:Ca2+-binding RTX toxin-like protein
MPAPTLLTPAFLVRTLAGTDNEPTVAAGRDGRFVIAWDNLNAGNFSRPGTVYQGPTIGSGGLGSVQNLDSASNSNRFVNHDAAVLTSGNVVFVGELGDFFTSDVSYVIYNKNADGTYAIGVSGFVTNATGGQYRPEIAALTSGGFVVAWENESDDTIKFQRYDASGAPAGGVGSVPTNSAHDGGGFSFDLVGLAGGGFAIANGGAGGLTPSKFSIFDSNGTAIVSNVDASVQATGAVHGQGDCAVTQLSNGNIAVAWYDLDGGGVGYRIFNSGGTALTGDLVIPSAFPVTGQVPRLAPTLDGRFMAVFAGIGIDSGVKGQMVNGTTGALDGASFVIDADSVARNPEIETTADGRIVVTWTRFMDAYAAIYDPREAGVNVSGTSGKDSYVGTDNYGDTLAGLGGNDALLGGSSGDLLDGGDGNDTIEGGFDSDQCFGGNDNDLIYGVFAASPTLSALSDSMYGGAGADTIIAGAGADYLDGGTGVDSLVGNAGGDIYVVDSAADVITETAGGGYDVALIVQGTYTLSANLEQAVVRDGGTAATGNSEANYLYGGDSGLSLTLDGAGGDDVIFASLAGGNNLIGGSGVDTLLIYGGNNQVNGGLDSDVYYTYSSSDILSEAGGSGIDTVYANWNIALGGGLEQLILFGAATNAVGSADANVMYGNGTSGAVTLFGLAGADVLFGGAFNDALDGGSEDDYLFGLGGVNTLTGGAGNDIFYVETAGNTVNENVGEGFDTLYSNAAGVTTMAANIEQLILYGAATGGTGTSGNDYLYANSATGPVTLDGGGGADYLLGSAQNDTLIGGTGADQIDLATGGVDRLRYNTSGNMGADTVYNFNAVANDLIDLTGQGYAAGSIGSAITITSFGGGTLVTFTSGSLAGTTINLTSVAVASVTAADFVGLV